jgi:ribosomal protein S18 acetylase RimI-like enzyme
MSFRPAYYEGKNGGDIMMIRKRKPTLDDRFIYRMIVKELLPYHRQTSPQARVSFTTVRKRLNLAITKVSAAGLTRLPTGFITYFKQEGKLFIDMLAVSASFQSKGIGGRLLMNALNFGKREGCKQAMLYVDKGNEGAQRFYTRYGFRIVRLESGIQCYLMSRDLD